MHCGRGAGGRAFAAHGRRRQIACGCSAGSHPGPVDRARRPQVSALVLNANGDAARFARCGLPVVADGIAGFRRSAWPACWPGSTGRPAQVAGRNPCGELRHRRAVPAARPGGAPGSIGRADGNTISPAPLRAGACIRCSGLWPVALREDLRRALVEGLRKVDLWTARYPPGAGRIPGRALDPFFNVNRPGRPCRGGAARGRG